MNITEIQRFCMHDGPGIRTVVFAGGCFMRCRWCHNPETQSFERKILFYPNQCVRCGACEAICDKSAHRIADGTHYFDRSLCSGCMKCTSVCCTKALFPSFTERTVGEVLTEVKKDRPFYGSDGGMTLSGGEPFCQPNEALELLKSCKENGIKTAVETSGYFDSAYVGDAVRFTDCFLWDFKDGNDERHRKYTGVSNKKIIQNLLYADSLGAKTILRCIMVNGVNMREDHYNAVSELWHRLRHGIYVELLPYHAYGGCKMAALGKKENGNPNWIPAENDMKQAERFLIRHHVKLKP